jgi:hypothetical protein
MGPGADLQRGIRVRKPELAKERSCHLLVVVLPGVNESHIEALATAKSAVQGRELHEIRSRPTDEGNEGRHQ